MELSKEQLLGIHGLELSGIVSEMDDIQFDEYCKLLFAFIENYSIQEIELRNFLNAKNYDAFSRVFENIRDMLEKIHAPALAQSSVRLLDELSTQKYTVAETHFVYLLSEISELSIGVQVVRQKSKASDETDNKLISAEKTETHTEDNGSKSILAVDDVSLVLNSLKIALNNTKYKLMCAKSGAEALKYIRNHKPDLFILDISMPEMDGYELAEKIKNSGHTAPIIFLTGNAEEEYVIKAINAGAVDFIVKPVINNLVLQKIKKYIG